MEDHNWVCHDVYDRDHDVHGDHDDRDGLCGRDGSHDDLSGLSIQNVSRFSYDDDDNHDDHEECVVLDDGDDGGGDDAPF